jgi:type I restriction enzyme, R subunit
MSTVGQRERAAQNRVVKLFQKQLGYAYLGNWQDRPNNRSVEEGLLTAWLQKRGVSDALINRALHQLGQAAALGEGKNLYDANKAVYSLLRYGVKVKPGVGEQTQTVWLIDWKHPLGNDFAIAEEVTIAGEHRKRPDIVLYVNGIALGVLELKRASVSVSEGIRQNLSNQKKAFIRAFFAPVQLVMAGNDTEGLRYGTIETKEKYYLTWKEENPAYNPQSDDRAARYLPAAPCVGMGGGTAVSSLDCALLRLADKNRFLEMIHDFIVFDGGVKENPPP